jgi:hypothetical protein
VTRSACDWSGCSEGGTHQVHVNYTEGRSEDLNLCRDHDDAFKAKVRQKVGPKPTEPPPPARPAIVACGDCGRLLDEPQGLPADQRQPCAGCGSTKRQVRVTAEDRLEMHESVTVVGTRAGQPKGKWFQRTESGDSYTRDHDAWGERILDINRELNSYREALIFWDGTTLESASNLRDHSEPGRRRSP